MKNPSREKTCARDGCSTIFISTDRSNKQIYCSSCRTIVYKEKDRIYSANRRATQPKVIKPKKVKLSKRSIKVASIHQREIKFEMERLRAIQMSPDVSSLISYSPDNGKTIIYCKNAEQLSRARVVFSYLHKV